MKLILICILIIPFFLFPQNYMEQIAYLEGDVDGDWFGKYTAALDFNGDGYDDLAVASPLYNDEVNENTGRISIFFGDEIFDDEADLIIQGSYFHSAIGINISNLGDMNGDGKEDLGFTQKFLVPGFGSEVGAHILLGNSINNTDPEFVYFFPYDEYYEYLFLYGLGDINNDGFDDAGIAISQEFQAGNQSEFYLIYGTGETLNAEFFKTCGIATFCPAISGIGDVNNDNYDDFCVGYPVSMDPPYWQNTGILYYGGEVIDSTNTVILYDSFEYTNSNRGMAAGYFNGDEYPDFIGYIGLNNVYLWYGNQTITDQYDFVIESSLGNGGRAFDYGDLNNDGFDDLVFGHPHYGFNQGTAYLFLGSEDPNTTDDYQFDATGLSQYFGSSISIGNFNGDEFEDVAISGPEEGLLDDPGYVHVYSGNAELEDLVGINNNEIPIVTKLIGNYPNPFKPAVAGRSPATTIEYSLTQDCNIDLTIYNLKGQRIKTLVHGYIESGNHSVTWDSTDDNGNQVGSGIYLYKLETDGRTQAVKKMLLLR